MIDKNTHLKNTNTLMHTWDPVSTQETLALDNNGSITVVPSLIEVDTQAVILREFQIFANHCQLVDKFAKELKEDIERLPNTNITQYHEKISIYQGAINLLSKQSAFLKKVPKILKHKYEQEKGEPFPDSHDRANHIDLNALDNTIKKFRKTQRQCAMSVEQPRGYLAGDDGMPLPQSEWCIFQPRLFEIGSYTYQDINYTINVGFELEGAYVWDRHLTKNPLGDITFKILSPDTLVLSATVAITWIQREYPLLFQNHTNNLEPMAWGVHYPSLYVREEGIIPCINPTLLIKGERLMHGFYQPAHRSKLYQALVEWMQFYNFDKIVAYDFEEHAPERYQFGFSVDGCKTPADMTDCLTEPLGNGVAFNLRDNLLKLPFTLRNNQLHLSKLNNEESHSSISYAELIATKPLLNKKCMPSVHPSISGVSFLPYHSMVEMLRCRETAQPPKKNPVTIKAVDVDFCDLLRPTEMIACAQVGSEDLKLARIGLEQTKILKVKRF